MDAWLLAAVAAELRAEWTGARVQKLVAPSREDLRLELYRGGRTGQLLLSTHPELCRVHLTEQRAPAAGPPGGFIQALRRHIDGSRLRAVVQPGLERVLELQLEARDELGNPRTLRLVAEVTGRLANLLLLAADGRIIAVQHQVGAEVNRVRELVPGARYLPPPRPPDKVDPVATACAGGLDAVRQALEHQWADRDAGEEPAERLLDTVFGLSPRLARALAAWSTGTSGAPPSPVPASPLTAAVLGLTASILDSMFRPCISSDARGRPVPLAWPLPGTPTEPAAGANRACASAYAELQNLHRAAALRERIRAALARAAGHVRRRLAKQERELEDARAAERLRAQGELLLCYPHLVTAGSSSVSLPSLEDPEVRVDIALDPRLSAVDNAQRLLRRYRKEKRANVQVAERLAAGRAELLYLEEQMVALQQCEDMSELQALADELRQQSVLPAADRPRPGRRSADRAPKASGRAAPPLTFAAGAGWRVLVGRNAAGNDHLTMRLGRPDDVWLHARQMPGSHVLLRGPDGVADPPEDALLAAARCAAYYSAGRSGRRIPVDWTRRRRVWKPPGSKPGFVLYEGERTLLVDPVELPARMGPASVEGGG